MFCFCYFAHIGQGQVTAIKWSVERIVCITWNCFSTDQLYSLQKLTKMIFSETSVKILGGHQHLVKVSQCNTLQMILYLVPQVGHVLNLTCVVTNPPSPQKMTQWLHNDRIVTPRSGVSIMSESSPQISTSCLIIHSVHERDAGSYRCAPGDTGHDMVRVDIIKGEYKLIKI